MTGKSKLDILDGHFWALDKMRPALRALFKGAIKAEADRDGLQLRAQKRFDLLQIMEAAATLERAHEIYAAAIFLVFDQWIRSLHKRLGLNDQKTRFGETIRNVSLAELIRATDNNFRHHDDWDKPTIDASSRRRR